MNSPDPARPISVKQPDLSQCVESRLQVKMNSPDSSRDISIKQEEPEDYSHLDILHMVVCKEEISSKQERSHRLLQEELEPPHIKEEELLKRPEEPAGSMLTLLPVKIEDGDEDISSRIVEVEVELESESESEDILHMVVCKEEVSPKQERSHRLLQEELEPPHIKDEEEELLKRPEEPAGSMLTLLAEVEVKVESDTELTEDSDWDETSGGQSASNTSSITRKRQGDAEEQRSYSHLNCAQSIQKTILLINTPWQMQDASAKKPRPIMPRPIMPRPIMPKPINVIYANALDTSNVPVINIPLVLASNGHHYGSLIRSSERQHLNSLQKHTSDTAFPQQTDTVLKSKMCKKCKKTFKNLQLHLRRSSECQHYGIDSLQNKNYAEKLTTYEQQQLHTQARAQHTIDVPIVSKHPTEVEQLHTQARAQHTIDVPIVSKHHPIEVEQLHTQAKAQHTIDVPIVSKHHPTEVEVCKQCHRRFLHLNMHLSKSPPCQSYYDVHSLQRKTGKHATSNRQKCNLYRQRKLQLQTHAKAQHTIDVPIVSKHHPTEVEQLHTQAKAQHTIDVPIVFKHHPTEVEQLHTQAKAQHTIDVPIVSKPHPIEVEQLHTQAKAQHTIDAPIVSKHHPTEVEQLHTQAKAQHTIDVPIVSKPHPIEVEQLHTQAKAQHTIDVPIVSKHHPTEVEQLHTQAKAQHTIDVPIVSKPHPIEVEQLHTQTKAQHTIDVPIVSKHHPIEVEQLHTQTKAQHTIDVPIVSKHPTEVEQLHTQAKAQHTIDVPIVSKHHPTEVEVCKQCHRRFRLLNIHLSKSPPCRTYYGVHSLQKKADKHATSNRQKCHLYRQRKLQLQTQAKAQHTIDVPIVSKHHPTKVEQLHTQTKAQHTIDVPIVSKHPTEVEQLHTQAKAQHTIDVPIVSKHHPTEVEQLHTQAKAQHTIDVPIVSKHPTEVEVCKQCHGRFLHLNMHLSKSPPCQSYYDVHSLQKKADNHATSNRQKCKLYRQRKLQLQTQAQAHCTIDTTIVSQNQPNLEVCKQCHSHFRLLNIHLSKSPPCRTYYGVQSLQGKAETHATSNRQKCKLYRQRKQQLQAQAHCTIDTTIVPQNQPNLEVCKQCHSHFRFLNMHLCKSPPCQTYYDIHSLQKKVDKKRQRQLKAQAKAHDTTQLIEKLYDKYLLNVKMPKGILDR